MSHGPHADASDPFQRRVAVFMALFTVLIAFNGMLTSQARTKALLYSNQATNQWSYYQSKSTKQNLAQAEREILAQLPEKAIEGKAPTLALAVEKVAKEYERYEVEKEQIKKKAEEITEQGERQEHREHWFEYATVIAEIAIVLASVALLLSSKKAFLLSLATAVGSIALTLATFALH